MTPSIRTVVAVAFCSLIGTSFAHAQATRTWVSGVGDDVNPCSRTAPCKTFAGAISKTAAGGEISVLDPGGYGAVTITKSITISGDGTLASILHSSTNGIVINEIVTPPALPSIRVVIRNISINGAGATLGLNGVRFISGANLILDRVTIENVSTDGIVMEMGNAVVKDSTITNANGVAAHSKGTSSITLENTTVTNNNIAVQADLGATIRMSNSGFYNNKTGFACGTGGTLASAGNNRKANNTGGAVPVCTPTLAITLQ